jgi:hypothetical protein
VDVLQLRGLDTQRFIQRFGEVPPDKMDLAIGAVIEYP